MVNVDLHPEIDTPFDASDPEQVKKRELEAKRREKSHREAIGALLNTKAGRSWMFNLLESCNMFSTTFVRGEPESSAYNEGRRSVAIQVWTDLEKVSAEAMILMRKEGGR